MRRPAGYVALVLAAASAVTGWVLERVVADVVAASTVAVASKALLALAAALAGYGLYLLVTSALLARTEDRARRQTSRNLLRLTFVGGTAVAVLAVVTEQWVGLLFSLGVIGFGITFALQQPLFSLVGWLYISVKRPYTIGDRVAIGDSTGDVVDVDLFVTTLWEVDGDLVSSEQPSGRTVTVPNSVVLSSHVHNYTGEPFPYVWNELRVQVAYETDLAWTRERMAEVADDYLGDEMARRVQQYRRSLADQPVELEVEDRPKVNIATVPQEAWVELRLRYLVDPRQAQQTRNELFERLLPALQEEAERVKFPLGRNR